MMTSNSIIPMVISMDFILIIRMRATLTIVRPHLSAKVWSTLKKFQGTGTSCGLWLFSSRHTFYPRTMFSFQT